MSVRRIICTLIVVFLEFLHGPNKYTTPATPCMKLLISWGQGSQPGIASPKKGVYRLSPKERDPWPYRSTDSCMEWPESAINVHVNGHLFSSRRCLCRWNWSGIANKCYGREDIAAWVIIGVRSLCIACTPSLSIYKRRVYTSLSVERLWCSVMYQQFTRPKGNFSSFTASAALAYLVRVL